MDGGARWQILTPTGAAGAIAIIQIEGNADAAIDRLGVGPLGVGDVRLRSLCSIDHGLVVRWSPTSLHLMPHGGAEVLRALTAELTLRDILPAEPGSPAHYPEAADGLESLMLAALARAASPLAIDLLLDQPRRWREPPARVFRCAPTDALNRLINPPLVVALGPTNIGKSTLVNALAGRNVSIIADEPGTTRDHVGVMIDLGGLVVRYADTPGLRFGAGEIETDATRIALELARDADLLLLCGDGAHLPPVPCGHDNSLAVALRRDLGEADWHPDVSVCAPKGEGLAELVRLLRERLVPQSALTDPAPWQFWRALGLDSVPAGPDGPGLEPPRARS